MGSEKQKRISHVWIKKKDGGSYKYWKNLSTYFRQWQRSNQTEYQSIFDEAVANARNGSMTIWQQLQKYKQDSLKIFKTSFKINDNIK